MRRWSEGRPRTFAGLNVDRGQVVASELDPELQQLTERVSRELGVPRAAVVLGDDDLAVLRAHYGFPDYEHVTARTSSFCKFVVRDGVYFEVNDARHDERLPQDAVESLGISSYLGAPIVLQGKTVGTMCVVDTEPRLFDDRERGILHRFAALASRRLSLLATQPRELERTLHDRAVRPAFSEIRNRLQPVLGNVATMQGLMQQLVAARIELDTTTDSTRVAEIRAKADAVIADLVTCLEDTTTDTNILHRSITAIERASLVSQDMCSIHDVIGPATTLAYHRTKLVRGVSWSGESREMLSTARGVAVTALAAALAGVAESIERGATHGITASISSTDDVVLIELRAEVSPPALAELASHLAVLVGDSSHVRVHDRALQLRFATLQAS
ncbi:MAG TPA: GAF domain-containing protein [Kofleriaceae bacterium]|nr:GAF domain-containing protein [Kofleriaceae bacterium]